MQIKWHLKIDCKSMNKAKKENDESRREGEVIRMVQYVEGDATNEWNLDRDASRHLVQDYRRMVDVKGCSGKV